MTRHFPSIGFPGVEPLAVAGTLHRAITAGSAEPRLDGGRFVRFHDDVSGARLNVVVDRDGLVVRAWPSFRPTEPSTVRVTVTGLVPDGRDADADLLQVAPLGAGYALAVELEGGAAELARAPFGEDTDLEVVGLADALECYPDEAAYRSAGMPVGVPAVMPAGLVPLTTGAGRARATALCSGVVRRARRVHNEAGGGDFVHLVLETHGMTLDVVADPTVIDGPAPTPGRIVAGSLWLVARLADPRPAPAPADAAAAAVERPDGRLRRLVRRG